MANADYGLGIDAGSTTTKAVLVNGDENVVASFLVATGASVVLSAEKCVEAVMAKLPQDLSSIPIIGTGYGRTSIDIATKNVTEITCHAIGVNKLNPEVTMLIDVGGQDAKVIRIGKNGRPSDFELNDKCSAGTGRFLEVMARVLEVSLDELGPLAMESSDPCDISSTCTVFAESEVIGHIGSGKSPADIAAGAHKSMVAKIATLSKRVGVVEPVCVTGGVALNPAFRYYLSEQLGVNLWMPENPQLTGAIGAALLAVREL